MKLLALGLTATSLAGPASAAGSGNLIVNGGGETGLCATDWNAVKTVPGWRVALGSPSLVCYSAASFTTPSSPAAGAAFLADGPYGDSALMQTINISSAAASIDGGKVTYSLSGWIGGWGGYAGSGVVTATFLDANGSPLGRSGRLPAVTAAQRNNANGFVAETDQGAVPAGARSIAVQVQFVNTSGSYNVGYVDNLSLTLSAPVTAPTLTPPATTVPQFDHVFMVMMENTDFSQVIGDTADAPYINSLAQKGALFTNYSGVYHPSDENYLAVAGGDTFVQGAIYFPNIKVTAQHLGDELEAIGKQWKAYEQGMGAPCNLTNNYDSYYAPDDAPFINFTDISGNPARCAQHLFDTSQLTTDLQSTSTTPQFAWIAADDYYDGEASGNGNATSLKAQNQWLSATLQSLFASPAWTSQRSLLILVWDESETRPPNHAAGIVYASQGLTPAGVVSTASVNHYSAARTIEAALGVPSLTPNDAYAAGLNDAFQPSAAHASPTLTASMPAVLKGNNIAIQYTATPSTLSATNWIGVYPAGATPGKVSSLMWQYVPAIGGVAAFNTASLPAGSYAAWYLANDGYTPLTASPVSFQVFQ